MASLQDRAFAIFNEMPSRSGELRIAFEDADFLAFSVSFAKAAFKQAAGFLFDQPDVEIERFEFVGEEVTADCVLTKAAPQKCTLLSGGGCSNPAAWVVSFGPSAHGKMYSAILCDEHAVGYENKKPL